ncbi:hypothetical protein CYLTODRAFT_422391 [Cylindrobasidium torrendii FP15055 ss-10]|uniref:F-box domain-containing protein n=1 Tax=Cylindrobasidium torrendii FP15055 ss-10 TaxID=1314674 RepID=A0A0D7BDE7_9AGAR|nr:hypothetical protein CYLTODRAFT_422391 [Cylindrobasidium torrendii FP15055 ss-10]
MGRLHFKGSAGWNREQLKRADERNARIRCHIHGVPYEGSPMREIFFDVLARTKRLEEVNIQGIEQDIRKVGQLLSEPTPVLRLLFLHVQRQYTAGHNQPPFKLPTDALMGAPNLRRLSLKLCGIPWLSATFPKMTHLEVSDPPETVLEPWTAILDALRTMPLLESLILKDTCDATAVDVDASTLRLERLAYLELSFTTTVFSCFFKHLSFPALKRFSLILEGPDFHPAVAALKAVSAHSMDMLNVFEPTLYIRRRYSQELPAVVISSAPDDNAPFKMQLTVTGSDAGLGRSPAYMTMLQTIGDALPLPQVRFLHVTAGYEEITGPGFAILNRCAQLHEIHLAGLYGMHYLFDALQSVDAVASPHNGRDNPTVVFPNLEKMVISEGNFVGPCRAWTIEEMLARRADMELPILKLDLIKCRNLRNKEVLGMEEYTQVNWNGYEYLDKDGDDSDSVY